MTPLHYGSVSSPCYYILNASFTISILSTMSTDYVAIKLIIICTLLHKSFRNCRVK